MPPPNRGRNLALLVGFSLALAATPAPAQEEDLIAPLTPALKKSTAKKLPRKKPKAKLGQEDADLLVPLAPAKGEVWVKLARAIKGASLLLDGREVGGLPQAAQSLPVGEHTVAVKRLGFADFTRKIRVAAGKTVEVLVTLEPLAGFAAVSSDVPGAQVYLDGRLVGTAPQPELLLWPGTREISVRKPGYQMEVRQLSAKAGSEHTVAVRLQPEVKTSTLAASSDRPERAELTPDSLEESPPAVERVVEAAPLYQRWYFWTGVAVLAGAATSLAVASAQPSAEFRGLCGVEGRINAPDYCR